MINYNDADAALQYLVSTDEDLARTKTLYEALYSQKKTKQAIHFINESGNEAERTQKALPST